MEVLQVSVVLESDAQPLSLVHGADIKMEIDLMLMHKINNFDSIITYYNAYLDSHLGYNLLFPKQNRRKPPYRCKRRSRMVLVTCNS